MDGFELAETMRANQRTCRIPVILVASGSKDQNRIFKGFETGAVDVLFRPLEPHVLRGKVKSLLDLGRQQRVLARQAHELADTLRYNELFVAVLGHDLKGPMSV